MPFNNPIVIPIIPYGLRHEEAIVQIAAALVNIDSVVTDVFEQIESNIRRHKEYLASLQRRSDALAAKVDKLAGKNIITTVYSCHKFPFDGYHNDPLFRINLKLPRQLPKVPIKSKFQPAKYNKTTNKLHFFHVKSSIDDADESIITQSEALGVRRSDINSVDSLFLSNTSQNVYEKYVLLDPLSSNESGPNPIEEIKKIDIAEAPSSILRNDELDDDDYANDFYMPAFEEVPGINVPADLPDLPGIAGNLVFNIPIETSAAPSKPSQSNIDKTKSIHEITNLDLPKIVDTKDDMVDETAEKLEDNFAKTAERNVDSIPQPPPLPPINTPPPPPPMPSNIENKEKSSTVPNSVPSTQKPSSSNDNMHANLMEAIRKAGGKENAKLRQIGNVENTKMQESKTGGEDLFLNDLYAALSRRRKGISGQNKDKNLSMMDKVSAMIKPSTPDDSDDDKSEIDTTDWDE